MELPFYNTWSNNYDRKVYFEKNKEERGRRNLSARDDKKTLTNKFMNRNEFKWAKQVEQLQNKLDLANTEIKRKEEVIQYMRNNYDHAKQQLVQTQHEHQQQLSQIQQNNPWLLL